MDETIPLVAEQLDVGVRTVETGRVHIATRVVETEQTVAVPLQHDEVEVETVGIDRVVSEASPTRCEGDVTIVPIYEERLVVTKQLVLKEELHIRKRSSTQNAQPQVFTLRHEEIAITRDASSIPD